MQGVELKFRRSAISLVSQQPAKGCEGVLSADVYLENVRVNSMRAASPISATALSTASSSLFAEIITE
jgi:hypothetical protein